MVRLVGGRLGRLRDWADPVLAEPLELRNGQVLIPSRPGLGMRWNEKAVRRYAL